MPNVRAWRTECDYALPGTGSVAQTAQSIIWCLAKMLTGGISGPTLGVGGAIPLAYRWAVMGSSDSAAAAMDGVDRWTTANNVVNALAGTPHSWIVLRSPLGLRPGGYIYLTLDRAGTNSHQNPFTWSTDLPTGGTINNAPTATKPFSLPTTTLITDSVSWAGVAGRAHITMNERGAFWFLANQNARALEPRTCLGLPMLVSDGVDAAPVVGIADFYASRVFASGDPIISGRTSGIDKVAARDYPDAASFNGCLPTLVTGSATSITASTQSPTINKVRGVPNEKWDTYSGVLFSWDAGESGIRGVLEDFDWTSEAAGNMARFPATGDIERVLVGGALLPFTAIPNIG